MLLEADAGTASSTTKTTNNLVASDHCLSPGGIRQKYHSFDEVAKSRSRGLKQNVAREESVVGEENDLAGARGMAGDTEQTPTRKIVILDRNSHDLGSIGRRRDSPVRGGKERVKEYRLVGIETQGYFLFFTLLFYPNSAIW